jgi:hypothetical protein
MQYKKLNDDMSEKEKDRWGQERDQSRLASRVNNGPVYERATGSNFGSQIPAL